MVLLVVSLIAFLAASALTVVAVAEDDSPEPCCVGPVARGSERPSPTTAPPASRAPGLSQCVVGSWRTVEDTLMVKFYTDVGELPMTTSGRYYEFRPDGTGVERTQNVQLVGNHNGTPLRLVVNGWYEFTWTATATKLNYTAITKAHQTWAFYDNRGHLETVPQVVGPQKDQLHSYTCDGERLVETHVDGGRSVMARTADYGYYG